MIRSQQTFYYGYFEARVKLPHGRGVWPAFWINSDYNIDGQLTWPPEIDVFEYPVNGRQDTDNMFHSAGSTFPKGAEIQYAYADPTYSKALKGYKGPEPLNKDWHVFGLLWLPDSYTIFLDGKKIFTRAYQWVNNKGELAAPAHILFNFAVGGQWAGTSMASMRRNFRKPSRSTMCGSASICRRRRDARIVRADRPRRI